MLGSDSTSVATDIYRHEMRPYQNRHEFKHIKIRQHLKWYVTAILDHLVILCSTITSKRIHDSPVLKTMLNKMKKIGIDLFLMQTKEI